MENVERPTQVGTANLAELERLFNNEMLSYNSSRGYVHQFSLLSKIPTVNEAPHLCVAVPALKPVATNKNAEACSVILPRDSVVHCLNLIARCQREYREQQHSELRGDQILMKFQHGRSTVYPKISGNYIYTMGAWHGIKNAYMMVEKCIEWFKEVDVEEAQLGSLFGEGTLVDADDVCTCIANINLQDEEEAALLRLVQEEAEDVSMTAAISVICADANSRPHARIANIFSTQLMAMGTDSEKLEWLKENKIVETSEDKIVGALWVNKNHWCGLGISLKTYVYIVMDPHNDKDTIDLIDGVFKTVFLPILPKEKRWRRDVSRYFQQIDGNSCGVLVLAFVESYLFESLDISSDPKLLRLRYLLRCF